MSSKRKYELKARAQKQAETRQRITEATVALHEEVGPARTTVAEVARRAGVTRLTVYNNFPEERELFAACQGHWLELHPPPRLDPSAGAEPLLRALYGWYRETARMAENVRRDRATLPELDALLRETADAQTSALAQALGGGPLAALALDFWTWRRLEAEGLDDAEAAALMADIISP
ncbi:MAG TPA: helix-turn-helix domain-containing protein [Thermoleophilaceae bacterium]|nr:helix-turn-helix domain-containing protein [Thermoleophilaceae bacterium]